MAQNLFGKIDSRGQTPITYNFTPLSTAEAFSTSKAYAVGDYCFYSGDYYKCKTAKAAGAWSADNFEKVTISEELKGIVNGYHPAMTAGDAEQLVSTQYVVDKTPYLFRTTGGSSDVGNREYVRGITGGTVAWNQLCNGSSATVPSGHKYLSKIGTAWSVAVSAGAAITGLTSGSDMVIDLTQMFGTAIADYIYSLEQANAGAGVAWFRKLFPNDYYEYNAGELKSVEGVSSHEMVGFNAWDEQWEQGRLDITTGENAYSATRIRSKNYIPIIPSTDYYWKTGNQGLAIVYYDADKTFISGAWETENVTHTTPSNAHYMKFCTGDGNGGSYNVPICINISWDGERDGEYEEYVKHSYELDSDLTLRGIPKLDSFNNLYYDGDEYESNGTVTRKYGVVDLGTLDWSAGTDTTGQYFYSPSLVSAKPSASSSAIANVICEKYVTSSSGAVGEKNIAVSSGTNPTLYVRDTTYNDAAAFKIAMSGVYLVYELATPTTETADPYTEIQICDDWGTEEYVSTSIVPVGHTTDYPANLRDKLQHLPDLASADGNYIVSQSGTQMTLAPLPIVIPAPPTTDGTYTFRATVSNGVPTLSWVEE